MGGRVRIEPVEFATDARGMVVEPVGPGDLPGQRNAHLVITAPGCVRGNHYHERGTEITLVLGPALLRYREDGAIRDVDFAEGTAARVTIPPGIAHAFQNPGDAPMILLGFNTEAHDPARPDVVRDVLIVAD